MASRALTTTYSKLLSQMAVRSLRTFSPSYSNSQSDIPTNGSDLKWRSNELPCFYKKNRVLNPFLLEGSAFPLSRYKMGEIPMELKNSVYIKRQMMMRNTCDRQRRFTSHTDAVNDATNVESNAFSAEVAGDAILKGPRFNHPKGFHLRMARAVWIKGATFPYNNFTEYCRVRDLFVEQKHNIILENYGLYKRGNTDWHVDGVSKLRYISREDFV
ncbi:uncharacterized protein LOC132279455 [Cornus florida]|uniref:uncharacterized protein LOC132279455 n=1 Tax=Cornus florida TaxID=4283 RepID=UPI00289E5834|nr:uncharacterized protein LOC132279455 [Cornus florida]